MTHTPRFRFDNPLVAVDPPQTGIKHSHHRTITGGGVFGVTSLVRRFAGSLASRTRRRGEADCPSRSSAPEFFARAVDASASLLARTLRAASRREDKR